MLCMSMAGTLKNMTTLEGRAASAEKRAALVEAAVLRSWFTFCAKKFCEAELKMVSGQLEEQLQVALELKREISRRRPLRRIVSSTVWPVASMPAGCESARKCRLPPHAPWQLHGTF